MSRSVSHSLPWRKPELLSVTSGSLEIPKAGLTRLIPAAVAIVTGVVLANDAWLTAMLIFAIAAAIALARVPWLPYVAVLATVATVAFYTGWPEVHGIKVPEFVLGAALLAGGARIVRTEWRAPSMPTVLMILFLSATAAGLYLGVEHGATLDEAIKGMRPMVFYAAFWPAFVVATDPRWRLLVMRLAASVVPIVVGLQVAQIHVGLDRRLFAFTSVVEHVVLTPQPDGFLRVRPPALTLMYVVAIFAAAYLLWGPGRHRLRASFVCVAGALGVLLSLNRNMAIGIVLGLTISALIVPRRNRFLIVALVSSLLAVASLSLWQAERRSGTTSSVTQRVLSIGDVSELRSGTLSDRSYENRFAIRVLKSEPLTGIGWGTSYGATLTEYRDGRMVTEPRGFLHQQYLWIWMRTGLVGLLALLIFLGVALASAAKWSRNRVWDEHSWLGPAVFASTTALMASATVGTYLTNPESIVVLMGVLALAYALRKELALSERKNAA